MSSIVTRKSGLWLWFSLWPFLVWCLWTPMAFSALKAATVCNLILIPLGAFILWQRARIYLGIVLVTFQFLYFWPARPADASRLMRAYSVAMNDYIGTPYVWGGENGRGIDCSGLMRRGMIDALWHEGWGERNPALWREAAIIWWRDCSANAMKNGYGGRIEGQFEARRLNDLDTSRLQIGDLAVMRSGVHVLAFIGERNWIQADPNLANGGDKVIVTRAPSRSGWFNQPVVICRWKILSTPHA